jgi:hypothetical protein
MSMSDIQPSESEPFVLDLSYLTGIPPLVGLLSPELPDEE